MKKVFAIAVFVWVVSFNTAITYAAYGVVDESNVLSSTTQQSLSSRENDLKQTKGIALTTVIINDGKRDTMNSAAAGHTQSAPSIVLVLDTKNGTAGWFPNGVAGPNPAGRISDEWLLQGKNTGNWDGAIDAANQYAVGAARQAKITGSGVGHKSNDWLIFGIPILGLLAGLILLMKLNPKRKRRVHQVSTPLEIAIADPEVSDMAITGNELTVRKE